MNLLLLGPPNVILREYLLRDGHAVIEMEDPIDNEFIKTNKIAFMVSYGYRHIMRRPVLEFMKDRIVNLHIAYLPWNRGADPNLWSFLEDSPKGVSIHYVDDGIDTGDIIIQRELYFTESKETANYLFDNLHQEYPDQVLCYTGGSSEATRNRVIANFDARARHRQDNYRILVSTEVLAEGVNLHRSNTVINYDIPWNPTRMMQRVGRINRVDTPFDRIYTYNFFPTTQSNDQIKLKEAAEAKINAFLTLLGGDAELLTEGEPIGSHELFDRLISKQTVEGEDGDGVSELKYLHVIREIRDKDPDLFEKIKRLPKKARTSKYHAVQANSLVTYFRRGKLQKFFLAADTSETEELDFITTAKLLESSPDELRTKLPEQFYDLLDKNKAAFLFATTEEPPQQRRKGGLDSAANILKIVKTTLKNTQQLTDNQELYLKKVLTQLEEGGLPKQTAKHALKALNDLKSELANPLKVLTVLQIHIPAKLLEEHYAEHSRAVFGKREVILSMVMSGEQNG